MTWVKESDTSGDDPALLSCSRGARLLYRELTVWSVRHSTDGKIPAHVLPRITDEPDPAAAIGELVVAFGPKPLVEVTDSGWLLSRFAEEQLSASEVETKKQNTRTRQERFRRHHADDHSMCDQARCNALRNASPDASSTGTGNAPLARHDLAGHGKARPGTTGSSRARHSPDKDKIEVQRCPAHNRPYSSDGEALCGDCPDLELPDLEATA